MVDSYVQTITDSRFSKCGGVGVNNPGAIYSKYSNFSLTDSTLNYNQGLNGGAVMISSSENNPSDTFIRDNEFSNNDASSKGGAIYYSYQRPELSGNIFRNNTAKYGPNIASFPVRIVLANTQEGSLVLNNVGSGIEYPEDLVFSLVDSDGQTMLLDSESTLKISGVDNEASLEGIDYSKVSQGTATFKGLTFIAKPGSKHMKYKLTSEAVNTEFEIDISFRY